MLWILFLKSSVDKYSLKGSIFMGLNDTPSGERIHIGFFGRRNAGNRPVVDFSIAHQRVAEFVQSFGKIVIFCENPDDDSTILQSGPWK